MSKRYYYDFFVQELDPEGEDYTYTKLYEDGESGIIVKDPVRFEDWMKGMLG